MILGPVVQTSEQVAFGGGLFVDGDAEREQQIDPFGPVVLAGEQPRVIVLRNVVMGDSVAGDDGVAFRLDWVAAD